MTCQAAKYEYEYESKKSVKKQRENFPPPPRPRTWRFAFEAHLCAKEVANLFRSIANPSQKKVPKS